MLIIDFLRFEIFFGSRDLDLITFAASVDGSVVKKWLDVIEMVRIMQKSPKMVESEMIKMVFVNSRSGRYC